MKSIFFDTSGFFALLEPNDPFHVLSVQCLKRAEEENWNLVTTNYVLHETWALVQARLSLEAVEIWRSEILPFCSVIWVDEQLHRLGEARWSQARERRLSLTDCISFEFMRSRGITDAIAQDEHFTRAGVRIPI